MTQEAKQSRRRPLRRLRYRRHERKRFHVFVNREDFKPGIEIPRDMEKEGIYHTAENSLELKGLKPGPHKVIVVLGYDNHVPWNPLVTATVTFDLSGN